MSDDDMFMSQKELRPTTDVPFVSKTQPEKSEVEYLWNVVFQWDIGNKEPFSLQPLCNFSESEVPPTWYQFKLRDDLRLKKIYVNLLNGQYSIFAKVEIGKIKKIASPWPEARQLASPRVSYLDTLRCELFLSFFSTFIHNFQIFQQLGASKTNRDKVLDSLNAEYGFLINKELSIDDAYAKMVATRPRRILSKHDYNNNGVAFRSARCAQEPKETDVSLYIIRHNYFSLLPMIMLPL